MTDADVFGPSIGKLEVQDAVVAHLSDWMPTYLGREVRKHSLDALPAIRRYVNRLSFAKWPEDQLPLVIVNVPGIVKGSTVNEGDGSVSKAYRLELGVLVSGRDEEATRKLIGYYGVSLHDAVLQHQSLGGFAEFTDLVDEDYGAFAAAKGEERTRGSVGFEFTVGVRNVLNRFAGPSEPLEEPEEEPGDRPTVETHEVEVTKT